MPKPKISIADVPHMLKMWDYEKNTEKPEDVYAKNKNQKHWKCPDCGYPWPASPYARYNGSGKCPCHETNKAIWHGVNDVLTIVKGLDAFIDDDNDFEAIYKEGVDSSLSVNFKCDECGRRWNDKLKTMIRKDGNGGYVTAGCPHYNAKNRMNSDVPYCTEVEAIIKFWDYENPMNPAIVKSNSPEPAHFICPNCGYNWTTSIRAQKRGTGKCKCCELQRSSRKGYTDVFTLVPDSKRYFNFEKNKGIDIHSVPIRDTKVRMDWKCPDCGHEWQSTMAARIRGNKKDGYTFIGCQQCYFRSRITPVASIPQLLKFWDFKKNKAKGLDPNLTSAYSYEPADWRCKECGYEWEGTIKGRMDSNGECPLCNGAPGVVMKGVNDVLTLCQELATIYDFDYNERNGINIYKEGGWFLDRSPFYMSKVRL